MLFLGHRGLSSDEWCLIKTIFLVAKCDGTTMNLRTLWIVTWVFVIRSRVARSSRGCRWWTLRWKSWDHNHWSLCKLWVVCLRKSSFIVITLDRIFFTQQLVKLVILLLNISLHNFLLFRVEILARRIHELQVILTFSGTLWTIMFVIFLVLLSTRSIKRARNLLMIKMLSYRHFVNLIVIWCHFFSELLPIHSGKQVKEARV